MEQERIVREAEDELSRQGVDLNWSTRAERKRVEHLVFLLLRQKGHNVSPVIISRLYDQFEKEKATEYRARR